MVADKVENMEEGVIKGVVISADLEEMVAEKAETEVKTSYTPFRIEDAHNNFDLYLYHC